MMKKVLKWAAIILLTPILLFLLLMVLLYTPPVQNWAVKKVAQYASEETGMDISVGHVALRFPLDLQLEDVKVIRDNDSIPGLRDTIADVGRVYADIQLKPLFHKKVEIDGLGLEKLNLNTDGLIPDLRVKGRVQNLDITCHGVDLKESLANITTARLDSACLDICLADTMPPDTTESKVGWKIKVDDVLMARTDLTIHMPGDTMNIKAYLGEASARDGYIDLDASDYRVGHLDLKSGQLKYDNRFMPAAEGLDANHIAMRDVAISVDSIAYRDSRLNLAVRSCTMKEKSGLQIDSLSATVALDSVSLRIPDLKMHTPDSRLKASVDMDLDAFDEHYPGKMYADVDANFGKQDLMRVMGGMAPDVVKKWPNQPLLIKGKMTGNMQRADIRGLHVSLPTAMQLHADGYVANLNDPDHIKADLKVKGRTDNIDFITGMLDKSITDQVSIPKGIDIDGQFKANGHRYGADFIASEGGGSMKAKVAFDADIMKYSATVDAKQFPLQHFLPKMGLSPITAYIEADGQGTDFMSPSTTLRAKAKIGKLRYDRYDLDGMEATATLAKGIMKADVDSRNGLLNGRMSFDAMMNTKRLKGTFACDLAHADFYKLRIADKPLTANGCAHLDIDTDFKDYYKVVGSLSGVNIIYDNTFYQPDDVELDVLTRRDTTYARINTGDFHLDMNGRGGYKKMLSQVENFSKELTKQLKDKHFDQARLRGKLPDANCYVSSGKENFVVDFLSEQGYSFDQMLIDMRSSHIDGLNGQLNVSKLRVDSIAFDEVAFNILTDDDGFKYNGQVRNLPGHPKYVFNAMFDGSIIEKGATINAKLYDKDERLGLALGADASIEQNGVMMHLTDTNPVIGYIPFKANEDNYVFLGDDKRLSAKLNLKADDGTHIQLLTNDENREALQDLTLSLGHIDLNQILSIVPYLPKMSGIADGDFHIVQTANDLSVSSALSINKFNYEGIDMGDLATEFVYLPNSDGSHHVDGVLMANDEEVGALSGTYFPKSESIDAKLEMKKTPLELINGFIPDQIIGFKGMAEGELTIKGKLSKPVVDGELFLENTHIFSIPYGVDVVVADDPVRIVGSNLLFENFEVFDGARTPLNISGYLDFSNLDRMMLDLRMRTRNFMVIDAKENARSEAFGKAYVNFLGTMRGPVDALAMRGRLDVLGSTDMTYVLKDSPLTTDNRLDELVKFVDFNDSVPQKIVRPPLNGFNMDLTMRVDETARIKCDLNSDHSNYIDLMGGGELRMKYNTIDDLRLTGRYKLSNGEMKYSLPVIPLKTFTIQEGSYIEFKGEPMNPTLHITATERTKAAVETEGGGTRSVDFDCGVVITQTLEDMGLEFIISAPEDVTIGTELAAMSTEEKNKVAVTMLTTGMYLADGNTSGFTMNGALSSFLQNEINNITGNALRTLDLSVGVDNAVDASGSMHTDYSFKFAKRFWNNRLRMVVGGKVSSGASTPNQSNSFLTNAALEYRLSTTSNMYLKLFYNRDAYDWIEGEVGEYGGGFLWRRKLQHFNEIFKFKTETPLPMRSGRDSLGIGRTGSLRTLRGDSIGRDALRGEPVRITDGGNDSIKILKDEK